jgi:hypothetical protein
MTGKANNMAPETEKDRKANEWLNAILLKLRFEQDYYIYPGSAEPMMKDGKQVGLSVKRSDIRLYSTGVTKLYEILVENKEYPDVEYTEAEEKRFQDNMLKRFPELAADDEAEGDDPDKV